MVMTLEFCTYPFRIGALPLCQKWLPAVSAGGRREGNKTLSTATGLAFSAALFAMALEEESVVYDNVTEYPATGHYPSGTW